MTYEQVLYAADDAYAGFLVADAIKRELGLEVIRKAIASGGFATASNNTSIIQLAPTSRDVTKLFGVTDKVLRESPKKPFSVKWYVFKGDLKCQV